MSNTKHTPGPWEARIGKSAHAAIYVQGTNHDVAIGVRPEDVRLIAAAPELLKALNDAKCAFDVFLGGELSDASAVERLARASVIVDAALAKAGV